MYLLFQFIFGVVRIIGVPRLVWLILIIVFLLVGTFFLILAAALLAWVSVHPPRIVPRRSGSEIFAYCEEVSFTASDGLVLVGWYFKNPDPQGALVLAHGMCSNRAQMVPWAEWLFEAGYSLLLFDFRANGESEGKHCTMGLRECGDVIAAGGFLREKVGNDGIQMGVVGFSMGGCAAIMAAGRSNLFRAVTILGAYTDLDTAITQRCIRHFGMFAPFVEIFARSFGERLFPGDAFTESPISSAESIRCPVLYVNGGLDRVVLSSNAVTLSDKTAASESLILQNTSHSYPEGMDDVTYRARVLEFFEANL